MSKLKFNAALFILGLSVGWSGSAESGYAGLKSPAQPKGQATQSAIVDSARSFPPPTFTNVEYRDCRKTSDPQACRKYNTMDVWLPETRNPVPVVVFIHGGGFSRGDKSTVAQPMLVTNLLRELYRRKLIAFASINYRLSTTNPYVDSRHMPSFFADAVRAIKFIRAKSSIWRLDRRRLALFGISAGADLSALIANHDDLAVPTSADPVERESSKVSFTVVEEAQLTLDFRDFARIMPIEMWTSPDYDEVAAPVWGLYGMRPRQIDLTQRIPEQYERLFQKISPSTYLDRNDPPTFIYNEIPKVISGAAERFKPISFNLWLHHLDFSTAYANEHLVPAGVSFLVRHIDDYSGSKAERRDQAISEAISFIRDRFPLK